MNAHATNWFNGLNGDYAGVNLTDDAFAVGDVVSLLSGSPPLTVLNVCDCGTVEVAWYDDHKGMNIDAYPEEALVHLDGSDD